MTPALRPRHPGERLIVALDVPDVETARALVTSLGDTGRFYKIGMQLAFAGGLDFARELSAAGKRVFLDMKLLDIDNTIAGAVGSLAGLGVHLTTVHAYPKAMRAAVAAKPADGPGLLAVTVLTSMDDADLSAAGYRMSVPETVAARARDARAAGMDGIVCAPQEARSVRDVVGPDMLLVVPGIRPGGSPRGDQKRVMTPRDAIAAGADYLVVGRPIVAASQPAAAAAAIVEQIEAALGETAHA